MMSLAQRPRSSRHLVSAVTRRRGKDIVKSAGRSLEVLELFRDVQRPMRLAEIAAALSLPASSASMLLRSLVGMGYLIRDGRTYAPSMRVALLGGWLNDQMFSRGNLMSLVDEVRRRTGDTVMLATRNGLNVEALAVMQGKQPLPDGPRPGDTKPLTGALLGHVILSALDPADCERLVQRINAEEKVPERRVPYAVLAPMLEGIRIAGFGTTEATMPGSGIIAVSLPSGVFGDDLVIGSVGAIGHVQARRDKILAALRVSVSRFMRASPNRAVR